MTPEVLTTAKLVEMIEARGMKVVPAVEGDGMRLVGKTANATPALLRVLPLYRAALVDWSKKNPPLIEVRWPRPAGQEDCGERCYQGLVYYPRMGFPPGAVAWRYQGETGWRPIRKDASLPAREVRTGAAA